MVCRWLASGLLTRRQSWKWRALQLRKRASDTVFRRHERGTRTTDSFNHEGVRSGGREPPHDLQLDGGGEDRIRADRRWLGAYLRRLAVAEPGAIDCRRATVGGR